MGPVPCNFRTSTISLNTSSVELIDLESLSGSVNVDLVFSLYNLEKGFWLMVKPRLLTGSFGSSEDYSLSLVDSTDDEVGYLFVSVDDLMAHNVVTLKDVIGARAQLESDDFDLWLLNKYVEAFSFNYEITATLTYDSGFMFVTLDFDRCDETIRSSKFLVEGWDSRTSLNLVPAMRSRQAAV